MNRRSFLKLLPTLPFYKVAWPQVAGKWNALQQGSNAPNILFLIFDTLSARHVSLYGYQRSTTPNLARFAEKATVFHNHHAAASFTSPGTASILTGTYPWTHRAFHLHGIVDENHLDRNIFGQLPDSYYRVAYTHNLLVMSLLHQFRSDLDHLKPTRELCLFDGEYADRAFFEDYSVAFWGEWQTLRGSSTKPSSLFFSIADRAFRFAKKSNLRKEYGQLYPRGIPNLHSLLFILEDAIDWIGQQVTNLPSPFFSYFHLLPPHEPYTTRQDFIDVFDDGWGPEEKEEYFASDGHQQPFLNRQRREYDEYLAFTDAEFGRLFDTLERSGILENTYLVVTSDHGEMFERGIRGHITPALYEPLLHVPLIILKPGQRERVDVQTRTSCVDLLPTFLQVTGQPIPTWCEGEVLPTFGNDNATDDRSIFALEAKTNPKMGPLRSATMSMVRDQYKLIHYFGSNKLPESFELYNVEGDPEELTNLYAPDDALARMWQEELEEKLQQVNRPFQRA